MPLLFPPHQYTHSIAEWKTDLQPVSKPVEQEVVFLRTVKGVKLGYKNVPTNINYILHQNYKHNSYNLQNYFLTNKKLQNILIKYLNIVRLIGL